MGRISKASLTVLGEESERMQLNLAELRHGWGHLALMERNSSAVSNTDDPAVYVGRDVICLSVHVGWKLEKGLCP